MSEWAALQWSTIGACWLQCPNCGAVTRFESHELMALYAPNRTKDNPNPQPFAKCPACDFQPYLPLELKHVNILDVVLATGDTRWASVDEATTRVRAETYGVPSQLGRGKWLNLKPD